MHDRIDPQPLTRSPHARLLAVATLISGVLVAGCAGGSRSATVVVVGGATAPASTTASASRPSGVGGPGLAFAKCMRSHGVPNFPDPTAGGHGFQVSPRLDLSSPAFKAAKATCQRFLPVLGGPGGPQFSEQSLVNVRKVAVCMRRHGIPQFPDPSTSRRSTFAMSGAREITDFDGVFLVFPSTLDMQSPAYMQAAAACGTLAQKLGRGRSGPLPPRARS
jgi:hypothetical protein